MDVKTWGEIDQVAEQEAVALRKARKFRSVWYIHHGTKHVMSRDQAIWDEHLEVHYTHCAFCGCAFDASEQQNATTQQTTPKSRSLFTKDIDICHNCVYLSQRVLHSAPAPARSAPSVLF